jgi:SAM-dependent MidA family methyltransferase
MPFDDYVKWALYDTEIGYYTRQKQRVGRNKDSDFFTSASFDSSVWGKLLMEASCALISEGEPADYVFVEIAAEPEKNSLGDLPHPFKAIKTIRLGEPLNIPKNSIVFSNEWLDAQPFKRYRFDPITKNWNEIGVTMKEGKWTEIPLPSVVQTEEVVLTFPQDLNFKYTIYWPIGAEMSLNNLVRETWQGLFITFDYGLDIERIFRDFPDGTGRSYFNQKMDHDLLEQPGTKDITCHVCWNKLQETLLNNKFKKINLQSQESFFMRYAANRIQEIIEDKDTKQEEIGTLKELIHPLHLGQKFQVLHGWRQ